MIANQGEVLPVAIPAAVAQSHAADAGFHEAACDQELFVDRGSAVVLELIWLVCFFGQMNLVQLTVW